MSSRMLVVWLKRFADLRAWRLVVVSILVAVYSDHGALAYDIFSESGTEGSVSSEGSTYGLDPSKTLAPAFSQSSMHIRAHQYSLSEEQVSSKFAMRHELTFTKKQPRFSLPLSSLKTGTEDVTGATFMGNQLRLTEGLLQKHVRDFRLVLPGFRQQQSGIGK